MCDIGDDFKDTAGGLMPWKGDASLVNQMYIKPRQEQKRAAKNAAEAEAMRQERISKNVADINSAFADREGQYSALSDAVRERLNQQLGLKRADATRQTKFSLARGGLTGGSAAIDAGKLLARENQEGVLGAERQARAAEAGLRSADEDSRSRLISLAQSGGDIGNAAQQTAAMLRANIGTAQNAGNIDALGDVFGGTAATNKAARDAAERRRGMSEATTYARAFSR